MKFDLREILLESPEAIKNVELKISESNTDEINESSFQEFMKGVRANENLAKYREGQLSPTSIDALVETISKAYVIAKTEIAKMISVKTIIWNNVLSNKAEPYELPAQSYALLGKTYGLAFRVISEAIRNSHKLLKLGSTGDTPMFARTDKGSRKPGLKSAFEELRLKGLSKDSSEDQRLNQFLQELKQCME
jgi:hypothetical protein